MSKGIAPIDKVAAQRKVLTTEAEQMANDILTMNSRCCAIWPAAPETATVRVGFSACFKSS